MSTLEQLIENLSYEELQSLRDRIDRRIREQQPTVDATITEPNLDRFARFADPNARPIPSTAIDRERLYEDRA